MSLEERVEELEDHAEELTEPETECIFCYVRINQRGHSIYTDLADDRTKEYIKQKYGYESCHHDEIDERSIWLANFLSGSLLHQVWDYNLEKQNDEEFILKTFNDPKEMHHAIYHYVDVHMKEFPNTTDEYVKLLQSYYPKHIEMIKEMYQISEVVE